MENLEKAYETNRKVYNLRSRPNRYKVGDIILRRNFALSNKANSFNAKLAKKFIKAEVLKVLGNCDYELKDFDSGYIGQYHAQNIQKCNI